VKIKGVKNNETASQLEIESRLGRVYPFPYEELEPRPTRTNPIKKVYVDKMLAGEAVTYVLRSGAEGAVHIEHAVRYSKMHKAVA
jgi:hypothetical protein